MKNENWKQTLDLILMGIDKDECEAEYGWWETDSGAIFGMNKKNEIIYFIENLLKDHESNRNQPS